MIFLRLSKCMLGPGIPPGNLDPKCPSISQHPTGRLRGKEGPGTTKVTVTGHYSQLRLLTALPPRCQAVNTLSLTGSGTVMIPVFTKESRGVRAEQSAPCVRPSAGGAGAGVHIWLSSQRLAKATGSPEPPPLATAVAHRPHPQFSS